MPDFDKLRTRRKTPRSPKPRDIFNRLVKPPLMRDLLPGQLEVLEGWWNQRDLRDNVIKQNTGGGKTLVGILIAESTMVERGGSVLYLCPDNLLVGQTIEKAAEVGISAVRYERKRPLAPGFTSGDVMMVASYEALFNGKSRFGVLGDSEYVNVSAIILDDAHVELAKLRKQFTVRISSDSPERRDAYNRLISILAPTFDRTGREGSFADIVEGKDQAVLDVPYWRWEDVREQVADVIRGVDDIAWPLIRNELRTCHCLIGRHAVSISPIFPPVDRLPTFANASRRIFMSATIADDAVLAATFGLARDVTSRPIITSSLASVGERMILIPGFRSGLDELAVRKHVGDLVTAVSARNLGAVVLAPSFDALQTWSTIATRRPDTPDEVDAAVADLQSGVNRSPLAIANRYDGLDLANDACRLLVMDGMPQGRSDYETYRSSILLDSGENAASMAQRIEQGLGRGSRGGGDWCALVLLGGDLLEWISKRDNWKYMTASTRAQIGIGEDTTKEIASLDDFVATIWQSIDRDTSWIEYHQEELFDRMAEEPTTVSDSPMFLERKAFEYARLSDYVAAANVLEQAAQSTALGKDYKAWFLQMAARYVWSSGDVSRSLMLQRDAYILNRNLLYPPTDEETYEPISGPRADQASEILKMVDIYTRPAAYVPKVIQELKPLITKHAPFKQFERALAALGTALGFSAEQPDSGRQPRKGPDVLWLAPNLEAFVIEAKNRKKEAGHFNRDDHGQLLQSCEWFKSNYPNWTFDRVVVLPKAFVTTSVDLGVTVAWDDAAIASLLDDTVSALRAIVDLPRNPRRQIEAMRIVEQYHLTPSHLRGRFVPFVQSNDRSGEKIELDLISDPKRLS